MSLVYLLSSSGMAVCSSPKLHQAGAPPPPFFGFAALSKIQILVRRAKFSSSPNYSWSLDGGSDAVSRTDRFGVLISPRSKEYCTRLDASQCLCALMLNKPTFLYSQAIGLIQHSLLQLKKIWWLLTRPFFVERWTFYDLQSGKMNIKSTCLANLIFWI